MPVSAFGNPLDYDRWREWSRDAGVLVLEDAAPALGSSYKGAKVGSFSDATAFSFHPRKSLTTGEGGMVLTNRRDWSDRMRSFKRFGLSVQPDGSVAPPFASIGSNYKLGDIPSALGIEQLKVLDDMVARRAGLAERYAEALRGHVRLPVVTEGGSHSYQTFCVYVDRRDDIMRQLINNGIEANIGTYNLHKEPAFQNSPKVRLSRSYPGGDYVGEMSLALPLYYEMSEETQDIVINALIKILNR
jgi:dTDP-4-amino-4,6-dideoxygalactose transaminase